MPRSIYSSHRRKFQNLHLVVKPKPGDKTVQRKSDFAFSATFNYGNDSTTICS